MSIPMSMASPMTMLTRTLTLTLTLTLILKHGPARAKGPSDSNSNSNSDNGTYPNDAEVPSNGVASSLTHTLVHAPMPHAPGRSRGPAIGAILGK
jgi:hypothetical protein